MLFAQMEMVIAVQKFLGEHNLPTGSKLNHIQFNGIIKAVDLVLDAYNRGGSASPITSTMAQMNVADRPREEFKTCLDALRFGLTSVGIEVLPDFLEKQLSEIASILLHELIRKPILSRPGMTVDQWLLSDDVGSSSMFIAAVLAPSEVPFPDRNQILKEASHPHDSDDFGRCLRLLSIFPKWNLRLDEVAKKGGKTWTLLVANWAKLTSLYGRKLLSYPLFEHLKEQGADQSTP